MRALFIILLIVLIVLLVYVLDYLITINKLKKENTNNIIIKNNTIDFNSLTLRQKISQMIIIYANRNKNPVLTNINLGGIFLDKQMTNPLLTKTNPFGIFGKPETREDYSGIINKYQENSKIKLFVATDMEGTWNPFSSFKEFPKFSEIDTEEEAYNVGLEEGKLMKELGFNLNFAPVAEYDDKVYGGRAFLGSKEEVKGKLENYINGLQKSVSGTCKHYPGKGMIKNLHIKSDKQNISKEDLELFNTCIRSNVSAIMIGHQRVFGEVDSKGKPSSVSKEVIGSLKNFSGLIISDEINMLGLRKGYLFNKEKEYIDLINSGENVILDFFLTPKFVYKLILKLEKDVKEGKIDEKKINESVKKILIAKGYKVK